MRRPEGFDRAPGARPPADRSPGRARAGLLDDRATPPPAESAPRSARPAAPAPDRVRSAKVELRAAARRRRREEKAEIRRFTRRSRRRRVAVASVGGVVLLLVAMIVGAVYSPLLALQRIDVRGTSRLDAAQVRGAVAGQLGTPLALLDERRLKRELGAFPLIRSYSTEIVPPDTLVVRVVERAPVAVLEGEGGFEAVDAAGVPVATSASRPASTPLIRLPSGQGVDGVAFRAMTSVLLALPPDLLARIDTVTATTSDDVAFTLADSALTVEWGSAEDSAAKLQTLSRMPEWVAGRPGRFSVASRGTATFTAS